MAGSASTNPRLRDVLVFGVAIAGMAMCLTLMYLSMRAVMDVGGSCADGGPYVSRQSCPEGSVPGLMLGVFGLFGFGALGMVFGGMIGGWGAVPMLAWTALFASLGWNFLDYGLVNPPGGEIEWGFLIPGIMFEVMAWTPVAFAVWAIREARRPAGATSRASSLAVKANVLRGPGQPAGRPPDAAAPPVPAAEPRSEELREIASLMGAAVAEAAAETPAAPALREADAAQAGPAAGAEFSEGTQALLDRLERLADMRDRGLLAPDEYETAKEAIMRELETRS